MISCADHDYVEIACMYRFEVKLIFKDGHIVQGKALETTYNKNKQECLVVETELAREEVVLDQLSSMEALTENPHFNTINFNQP